MNVTAALGWKKYIAPPLDCDEKKKETREKLERYTKEEEKKWLDMLIHKKIRKKKNIKIKKLIKI